MLISINSEEMKKVDKLDFFLDNSNKPVVSNIGTENYGTFDIDEKDKTL